MSETWKVDRAQGDPLEVTIDLKWSLWSAEEGIWADHAPETLAHIKAGIEGGMFQESGDTLVIHTAPCKEIRYGIVKIDPKAGTVKVGFHQEWDEDPTDMEFDRFPIPDTTAELLAKVDAVEARLIEGY